MKKKGAARAELKRRRNTRLDIGAAMTALRAGRKVARAEWAGPSSDGLVCLDGAPPTCECCEYMPIKYHYTTREGVVHVTDWDPSQADLLATDWRVIG